MLFLFVRKVELKFVKISLVLIELSMYLIQHYLWVSIFLEKLFFASSSNTLLRGLYVFR